MNSKLLSRSYHVLARFTCALLIFSSCASPPFEKEVTDVFSQTNSAFLDVTEISVIETMTQEQAQAHFQTRIIEERLRLLHQYKLRACEPCVIGRSGYPRSTYQIADLKTASIDSILWPSLFRPTFPTLSDSSGSLHCDFNLHEKKSLLDSANKGFLRKNEATIEYLKRILNMRPSFYHLKVTYLNNENSANTTYAVARVTAHDTTIVQTDLSLLEFLTAHKYPHPKFKMTNNSLVAASLSQMGAAGGGLRVLKHKPIGRAINENDYLPWDSIAFYNHQEQTNDSHFFHEGIFAAVDTSQVVPFHVGEQLRPSYPLFIYNLTDRPSSFSIFFTQQAKDSLGRWRAIEGINDDSSEGTPFFVLKPGQVGLGEVQVYEGTYKTKLRTKLWLNYGQSSITLFTNEYGGNINYQQFFSPKGRVPERALEEGSRTWFRYRSRFSKEPSYRM